MWEKVSKFNITIKIAPLPIKPPRAGDKWFMQAVRESGVMEPSTFAIINRFCCHHQVLFFLDVLHVGGKSVDKKYLAYQQDHKFWSTIILPLEKTHVDTRQCGGRWYTLLPLGGGCKIASAAFYSEVTKFGSGGYEESNCLLHVHRAVMDVYTPSTLPLYANRPNFWTRSRE